MRMQECKLTRVENIYLSVVRSSVRHRHIAHGLGVSYQYGTTQAAADSLDVQHHHCVAEVWYKSKISLDRFHASFIRFHATCIVIKWVRF